MSLTDVRPLLPEWADQRCPVIGMVHARPLPGAPFFGGNWDDVIAAAVADATALATGGVDGLMLENYGDTPFFPGQVPPITLAALCRLACEITRAVPLPLGINLLRNDGVGALAIAAACGARFIRVNVLCGARVTDQGVIGGIAHEVLRARRDWSCDAVQIWADVDVKHSAALAVRSLTDETHDLIHRGHASAVIVSGAATGQPTNLEDLRTVRDAAGAVPILVGSGVTAESLPMLRPYVDGVIVGTSVKAEGRVDKPVDIARVQAVVAAAR